jgi:8-amino-7-oxononanoate synthase
MSSQLDSDLELELVSRKAQNLYRKRRILSSPQSASVCFSGRQLLNFCSNDYLGLANHPDVISAFQSAANRFGVGSGASHLVSGHSSAHHELEEALAAFTGRQRALLFSTGYMANVGVLNALAGKGDGVFEDRLNHASLIDGGLLSGAKFQRFLHNDVSSLEKKLSSAAQLRRRIVVVDGVFSMDGDMAPLPDLVKAANLHNAWLMVDDAHGFGVLGKTGAGVLEHFELSPSEVPILMATLGKALGGFGAFVAGSETLIEALIQQARPYIYTTAMPPAVAASMLCSLQVLTRESWRRAHLKDLILRFQKGARDCKLPLLDSDTAIQPVLIGGAEATVKIANYLEEKGFLVGAIRPPTVPVGSSRLRITLSASHSEKNIDDLLQALEEVFCKYSDLLSADL